MINTDTRMLGWLSSPTEVGLYSAPQRVVQFLYMLPALFATSLFPTMSRISQNPNSKNHPILGKSILFSMSIAFPIAFGGVALGKEIILFLFGNAFINSVPTFQILILTTLIVFPSVIISNALFAHNQQRKFITFSLLGAIGNALFNFILIPKLGIIGCAYATLGTQIIAHGYMWKTAKTTIQFSIPKEL